MNGRFDDVQRVVLSSGSWEVAQHVVIEATERPRVVQFLNRLLGQYPPARAGDREPPLQVSLGFSRRGLEHANVPPHVLACLAARAPAFSAGAALRAGRYLGSCGLDAPERWDAGFGFGTLDAVLSFHALKVDVLDDAVRRVVKIADAAGVPVALLPPAAWPVREDGHRYVHFGYRDGLARVGIEGWSDPSYLARCKDFSRHQPGEFVLGHAQDSGANPWLSTDGRSVWPQELRTFFHNGSFGVLQQIEQHVNDFETFLSEAAVQTKLGVETIRAKLCGRTAEGRPVGQAVDPEADFDYQGDDRGERCPFGAHTRRMNPRDGETAHTRRRPLLRRGMPYGGAPGSAKAGDNGQVGLMGHFFCASLEDQFEHLLGQWADRVPLGSGDQGSARDPLIGAHARGDGVFEIPQRKGVEPVVIETLRRFTRTRGIAYLFYPSLTTLAGMARSELFFDAKEFDA